MRVMEPRIQYAKAEDGVSIAYTSVGEGPAYLRAPAWGTNLLRTLQTEEYQGYLRELGAFTGRRRFVSFDPRGIASSQRDAKDLSFDAQLLDIAAVADALQLDRFDLEGTYNSAALCVAYAVQHPERVSRLILIAAYACGEDLGGIAVVRGVLDLMRTNWKMGARALAAMGGGEGSQESARLIESSMSGEVAATFVEVSFTLDVRDLLPQLSVPTLILRHLRHENRTPARATQAVAAAIPNAQFIRLENDYWAPESVALMNDFLDADRDAKADSHHPSQGVHVRTILFTDLVGHTEMMQRLGDARGREVLREHERITRDTLRAHGGDEIKTDGDSFMVSFGSVTSAVACAVALQRAFASREGEPLHVRMGLNAGEPIEDGGDLFGATVILASRIKEQAGAGEILIPETVRGLLSGKQFLFSDRGEFLPKGFDDTVRLYEVRWRK
jgi:class 3 adenylate cyclase